MSTRGCNDVRNGGAEVEVLLCGGSSDKCFDCYVCVLRCGVVNESFKVCGVGWVMVLDLDLILHEFFQLLEVVCVNGWLLVSELMFLFVQDLVCKFVFGGEFVCVEWAEQGEYFEQYFFRQVL